MATIEQALRTKIAALSAVSAITTTIRPDKLSQTDTYPSVLIACDQEEDNNDLSATSGLTTATIRVRCAAESRYVSRNLAAAIKSNGTNPGSGLAGWSGTSETIAIQAAMLLRNEFDFVPYGDDSDEGVYIVDSIYQVDYTTTA